MSDDPEMPADEDSPAENSDSKPESEPKEPVSPKNQLIGLLLLLGVFGLLYAMIQFLPKLSSWMDEKRIELVEGDGKEKAVPAEKKSEIPVVAVEKETNLEPAKKVAPISRYEGQIIEQIGGEAKVEVRHLAISDDQTKMVAALRIEAAEGVKLTEVFFERDEFGRYLSTEDSWEGKQLKLWSE